jgi:hypothetical protein
MDNRLLRAMGVRRSLYSTKTLKRKISFRTILRPSQVPKLIIGMHIRVTIQQPQLAGRVELRL